MSAIKSAVLEDFMDILLSHEEDFRNSQREARKQVVSTIADEITTKAGEELTGEEVRRLEGVCKTIA